MLLASLVFAAGCTGPPLAESEDDLAAGSRQTREGEFDRAILTLSSAIDADPDEPQAYLSRARAYLAVEDYDRAIADCTRALEISPRDATAIAARAEAHRAGGNRKQALDDYARAIMVDRRNAAHHVGRARILTAMRDTRRAIDGFDTAIRYDPRNASAYWGRAEARMQLRDHDGAIDDLTRAIELDDGNGSAYLARAVLLAYRGDLDRALTDLTSAADLMPEDADVFYLRARTQLAGGRPLAAAPDLDRALGINADHIEALRLRSRIKRMRGDTDGAIADLNRLIRLAPDLGAPRFARGMLRYDRGEDRQAMADFVQASMLDPRNVHALIGLGVTRLRLGDHRRALACLSRAHELAPLDPRPLLLRSTAHGKIRDEDAARSDAKEAESLLEATTVAAFEFGTHAPAVVVPLSIAGRDEPFVLDTGANLLLVDSSLRELLGRKKGPVTVDTHHRKMVLDLFEAPEVRLGRVVVERVNAAVEYDLSRMNEFMDRDVKGIAGTTAFIDTVVQIDFDDGKVRFSEPVATEHPEWGRGLPMEISDGLVWVEAELMGRRHRFMLDTGMQGTGTVEADLFDELVSRCNLKTTRLLTMDLAGEMPTAAARFGTMRLGPFSHDGLILERGERCVLGLDYLARYDVTFDFRYLRLYLREGAGYSLPDEAGMSGVCAAYRDGNLTVEHVYDNTPGSEAGIKEGDEITHIDGHRVSGIPRRELFARGTSVPGTKESMTIRRGDKVFEVTLVLRRRL